MRAYLRKLPNGTFALEDLDADRAQKLAVGKTIEVVWREPRNYKFLKKMHVFFHRCYDYFCEHGISATQYKGQPVVPSYDKFRHDLVILAGHYEATYNIRGEVQLQAKSIAYENCTEGEAAQIFSDCIQAAIQHVYRYQTDEKTIRQAVDDILQFSGNW